MSPKYAIQFGLMSIAALLAALFGVSTLRGKIVLFWSAVAFAVVATAYGLGRPQLLMKRQDGAQPVIAWIILWPYFLLVRFSFLLYRLLNRGKVAVAEVRPGIWFARRLTKREIRESGVVWAAVLDLTAEFPRASFNNVVYRALPVLDGVELSDTQLREGVAWIDEQSKRGNVLVHCALGHGRTGSVLIAWLLLRGFVPNVIAGVDHLRSLRSTFGMSKGQIACVERFATGGRIESGRVGGA